MGTNTNVHRRQFDRHITCIWQNNSSDLTSDAYDLPSHMSLLWITIPNMSFDCAVNLKASMKLLIVSIIVVPLLYQGLHPA